MLPRLRIGKAEQEDTRAGLQQTSERADVGRSAGIVERMKQAAVGRRVESFRKLADRHRIHLQEVYRQPALGSLLPGRLQWLFEKVDPGDCAGLFRQPEGEVACPAANVDHPAPDCFGRLDEGTLRPPDIPRGPRSGIVALEAVTRRHLGIVGHGRTLSSSRTTAFSLGLRVIDRS